MTIEAISANNSDIQPDILNQKSELPKTSNQKTQQELDQIKQKVSNAGADMNAQQISNKYDITVNQAQKILDELEKSRNRMPETATMQFTV